MAVLFVRISNNYFRYMIILAFGDEQFMTDEFNWLNFFVFCHVFICVCMCANVCLCIHVFTSMCACVCVHMCMCAYVSVPMCIRICVGRYVCLGRVAGQVPCLFLAHRCQKLKSLSIFNIGFETVSHWTQILPFFNRLVASKLPVSTCFYNNSANVIALCWDTQLFM